MGKDNVVKKYTKEQLKAAYALNLCTVSISQIIEYNDVNIMEQEYETILNNLNLEHMPKDEALLKILKQLLDTITFFRIQEGDKRIIDKEYQHRVKNAIWSAVPNVGLIVAGGNLATMAISLASQVGIGYMNYRRAKADLNIEMEKKRWELERTAIEQFNGLRRELFDTAWRLATVYNFPDELRLTERQIKQYNEILMDYDEMRKYERLSTIKGDFIAYPPFWYHMGSVANRISQDESFTLETRMQYRGEALEAFLNYWKSNEFPLLREDYLASSCALEHIELLSVERDIEAIKQLLDKAEKYSGRSNDILQLCAIGHLKIGQKEKATELFRILVNEEYNLAVNSQILSGLYINGAFSDDAKVVKVSRTRYELLTARVKPEYLLRMPALGTTESEWEVQEEFQERQEALLHRKFVAVIQCYMDGFLVRLGKLIPGVKVDEKYPDFYYSGEGIEQRLKDMNALFNTSFKTRQKQVFLDRLSRAAFVINYFEEINRFFDEITEMSCLRDRNKLKDIIIKKLQDESSKINCLAKKMDEQQVNYEDMCKLIELTSYAMFEEFVEEMKEQMMVTILGMNSMERFAEADSALRNFCINHNMPDPDTLLEDSRDAKSDRGIIPTYFGYELLGEAGENYQREQAQYKAVEQIIRKYTSEAKKENEKEAIYFHNSAEFNRYFERSELKNHKDVLSKTIAIYDDKSFHNVDVLFTSEGIVPVVKRKVKENISYISVAGEEVLKKVNSLRHAAGGKSIASAATRTVLLSAVSPILPISLAAKESHDMYCVATIIKKYQSMIDEIATELVSEK